MNKPVILSREEIVAMIPHGAGMCMLDTVNSWNESQIECESFCLTEATNPLAEEGELQTIILVEYAAQAAAVHAALINSGMGEARPAYIGAVKNLEILVQCVNNSDALKIFALCAMHSDSGAIYEFRVSQSNRDLICGKLILSQPSI